MHSPREPRDRHCSGEQSDQRLDELHPCGSFQPDKCVLR
jgi:hypothetical protein